jgi:hypothetical protein
MTVYTACIVGPFRSADHLSLIAPVSVTSFWFFLIKSKRIKMYRCHLLVCLKFAYFVKFSKKDILVQKQNVLSIAALEK